MTERKRKYTSVGTLFLSGLLVGLFYLAYWIEGWVGVLLFLCAAVLGLTLIILLAVQIGLFSRTKNRNLLTPIIIGIIAVLIVVFRPVEWLIEKLKSPVVLYGYCEHTVTALSIKLRQDNSFEYNAGAFLSKEVYNGRYGLSGDTLMLNFNNIKLEDKKLILTDIAMIEIGDTTTHRHYFRVTYNDLIKNEPMPNPKN